ncbi:MAG: ATP-binding cassette domain-containing protein [Desulfobulbaceae bacterium]|nr:ATP-binding cassette domain-containing protein [Desulfobulbaceae bacterium]
MIAFHADNIQKLFAQRLVLDLDLHFEEAQLHVILGPNGSGKTSLLRLLALLDEPDRGEVLLKENGQPLTKDHNTRQRIVLVPRPDGLFNHTVSRNVAYGLKLRKLPKVQRSELIHEALEAVGLRHLRQANALTLSSGESSASVWPWPWP